MGSVSSRRQHVDARSTLVGVSREAAATGGPERVGNLVENVIPWLVLAHRAEQLAPARLALELVELLVERSVEQDVDGAVALLGELPQSNEHTLSAAQVRAVHDAAVRLGVQWNEDARTFIETTMGLGTLQRVVRRLSLHPGWPSPAGLVVLTTPPEEQHRLALLMLGEMLIQDGWPVHVEPGMSRESLCELAASEPLALVGISLSSEALVPQVEGLIEAVRAAAAQDHVSFMLGGAADLAPVAERLGCLHGQGAEDALAWLNAHARKAQRTHSIPPQSG